MKNIVKTVNYEKYYNDLLPYFKEEKNQKYLFLILTFGSAIFFLFFAISPTLSTIAKLNKQISDSKLVEIKLNQKVKNLSSLSQSYSQLTNDFTYLDEAIPVTPNAPELAGEIQAVAESNSVTLNSITVSTINLSANQSTSSASFSFSLAGTGQYASIHNFLNGLVNMQRQVSITTVQINNSSTEPGNLSTQISGNAYFRK